MSFHLVPRMREGQNRDIPAFHINNFGMSVLYDLLQELDAINQQAEDPDFPEDPGAEHFDPDTGEPIDEVGRRYAEECERLLAYRPEDDPRPPGHKFWSNDGWIVTREECQALLKHLQHMKLEQIHSVFRRNSIPPQSFRPWAGEIYEFVSFIRACAEEADGFTVS